MESVYYPIKIGVDIIKLDPNAVLKDIANFTYSSNCRIFNILSMYDSGKSVEENKIF